MSRVFGPNELLDCYRRGVFPMADSRDDPRLFLVDPDLRGVLPLNGFHVSKSLRKAIRIWSCTRSTPVIISVTGCSTCRRVFISMK